MPGEEFKEGYLTAVWNSERDLFPDSVSDPQRLHILGLTQDRVQDFPQDSMPLSEIWGGPREQVTGRTEEVLEGRLVEVLRCANESLARIEGYRSYWGDNDDSFVSLADKVIAETAILALVAGRHASERPRVRFLIDELSRSLSPLVRSIRNEALIRRYPNGALTLAVGHAVVNALGLPDPKFDHLVKSTLACNILDCSERLNFRAMERRWMTGVLHPEAELSFDDLMPMSIATRQAHPIHMLATDVYALTHVPMFVTDFGSNPAPADFPHATYGNSLDAAAAWVLQTENFDLMGELVLARELLGAPWTASHVLAWKILEHAWDHLGFLTSPSFSIKQLDDLPTIEKASYAFLHTYHTTYVAGMLSAIMLGRASFPPQQIMGTCAIGREEAVALHQECQGAFTAALEFVVGTHVPAEDLQHLAATARQDAGESPLQAAQRLMSLRSERGREPVGIVADIFNDTGLPCAVVASSLIDGLLTCAARSYDLMMLAELLRTVAVGELPLTPTVATAARFLTRQQLPSGAIGGWFLDPSKGGASVSATNVTTVLAAALGALSMHPDLQH
ncbi:hypothetical protein AB0F11_13520 [Streptomyces sp. NPDC032472]|uniref:DUF6895 family protein n=1 Tax=Streptomyces sp. NPDC032472 TaxID=3155018 RepID=UPI00340C47A2